MPAYALDTLTSHIRISCHNLIHLYAPHAMVLSQSYTFYYPVPAMQQTAHLLSLTCSHFPDPQLSPLTTYGPS